MVPRSPGLYPQVGCTPHGLQHCHRGRNRQCNGGRRGVRRAAVLQVHGAGCQVKELAEAGAPMAGSTWLRVGMPYAAGVALDRAVAFVGRVERVLTLVGPCHLKGPSGHLLLTVRCLY